MKQPLKSRILIYLRANQPSWVAGYELERLGQDWGYMGTTTKRRAQELAQDGKIERKIIGKNVWYRLRQAEPDFDPNKFLQSLKVEQRTLI